MFHRCISGEGICGTTYCSASVILVLTVADSTLCFCVSVSVPGGPDGRRDDLVLGEPEPPLHRHALSPGEIFPTRASLELYSGLIIHILTLP